MSSIQNDEYMLDSINKTMTNEEIMDTLKGAVKEMINRGHYTYSFETDCNEEVWKHNYLLRIIKELHIHLESIDGADNYFIEMNRDVYDGFTNKQKKELGSLFDILISNKIERYIIRVYKWNKVYVIDIDVNKAYDNEASLAKEHDK